MKMRHFYNFLQQKSKRQHSLIFSLLFPRALRHDIYILHRSIPHRVPFSSPFCTNLTSSRFSKKHIGIINIAKSNGFDYDNIIIINNNNNNNTLWLNSP